MQTLCFWKISTLLGKDFCGCDVGFFYNSSVVMSVSLEKYQDEQAKQTCKDCAIGKYQGEIGKISCKDCPPKELKTKAQRRRRNVQFVSLVVMRNTVKMIYY